MTQQWKMICKVKDVPQVGALVVPRGLVWQELPGVALCRGAGEGIVALLEPCPNDADAPAPGQHGARSFTVKLEQGRVYLDLAELNAPASRAEAALAGVFGLAPQLARA